MRDEELSTLLRSPALDLEPPLGLAERVRQGARRTRRRQAVGAAGLAAVAVVGAALVGPALLDRRGDAATDVASDDVSRLFPAATTDVVALADLNGGTVYTWFQGRQWCTASKRFGAPNTTCAGSLPDGPVPVFGYLRGPGTESLAVDRDFLVAGVLGDGVSSVEVVLPGDRVLRASTVEADGFPRPVWWQDLPAGTRVLEYVARDAAGAVLQRRVVGAPD